IKTLIMAVVAVCVIIPVGYFAYLIFLNGSSFAHNGDVSVCKAETGKWETLDDKYTLKKGDKLKTGKGASCSILLGNTAAVMVMADENTEVAITSKDPVELDLIDGKLLANLTRHTRLKKFTVTTPVGACGIRGTGWQVTTDKDSKTTVEVFDGRVKFGQTEMLYEHDPYTVPNDFELDVTKDETTRFVRKKLDPEKYANWNKWVGRSSEELTKIKVINYMVQSEPDPYPTWQEGVSYTSWLPGKYSGLESGISIPEMAKETNASWVNLVTTWYQGDSHSTKIYRRHDKTPTDTSLTSAIQKMQRLGMHIMLSPHLNLETYSTGTWRGEIGFTDNENWDAWFESYSAFVLHYAQMAEDLGLEIFNIGTELSMTTTQRPDKWIGLIARIREVYSGRLVYTANWFEEYENIRFWGHLDYAGISAYFPLSRKDKPSYFEIKNGWKPWLEKIEAWQKTHGKPVIFPEIGYRSAAGSAKIPWAHRSMSEIDLRQQYNCYKATFETFWGKPWFYGFYWWTWRTNPRIGGKYNRGFTPHEKPAGSLIKTWYLKPDPHKYKSILELAKDKVKSSIK
ncbi:MAG: FecR domain-containing protein, partial [Candidatus Omnitrophica bacterium]|nr:FecR domain-containing protein [Candidatus Omnitrophota bacterium]